MGTVGHWEGLRGSGSWTAWSPGKSLKFEIFKLLEMHWNCQSYHNHDILYHFKSFTFPSSGPFWLLGGRWGCVGTPRTRPAYRPAEMYKLHLENFGRRAKWDQEQWDQKPISRVKRKEELPIYLTTFNSPSFSLRMSAQQQKILKTRNLQAYILCSNWYSHWKLYRSLWCR